MVHHEALAQVHFLAGLTQNFVLKERVARVAPARAALVLVFDGRGFNHFDVGELESRAVGDDDLVVGQASECDAGGQQCQE